MPETRQPTPRCHRDTLVKIDQRTREARLMRETRAELIQHVGGNPSAAQRALIEQAVQIKFRLAVIDRRFAESRQYSESDTRTYATLSNALGRTLRNLGLDAVAPREPSLKDILAGIPGRELPHRYPASTATAA